MKRFFITLMTTLAIFSANAQNTEKMIWIQVGWNLGSTAESNYLQGKVDETTYKKLYQGNHQPLFLKLTDCTYYDDEGDCYRPCEDQEFSGVNLIPVKHIISIEKLKSSYFDKLKQTPPGMLKK